ncbi:MAG: stage III sporulation protein AE [Cellulosilyticaceae bacterium]
MQHRMPKKTIWIVLLMLFWVCFTGNSIFAQGLGLSKEDQDIIFNKQFDLINWDNLDQMQQVLKSTTPELEGFSLKDYVIKIAKGEESFSVQHIVFQLWEALTGEIGTYISVVMQFVLIVILCNLLQTLSASFETKNTTKVAFFVCYIVILYGIAGSLGMLVKLASTTIDKLCHIMYVAVPTLMAFMASTGHITTSSIFYPTIIGAVSLMRWLMQVIILPAIILVIVLQLVSGMSEDFKLDKLTKLFYRGTKFVLRGICGISVGLLGIYKLTTVPVDMGVKKAALKFSAAFIPVVGNAAAGTIEFIGQCATLMKNSLSGGIIILILALVSIPLIKILSYIILYHLAAAAIEPLGDKKMSNMAENLAKGCEFIMSCVAITALLSIVGLVICMSVGTGSL